MSEYVKAHEMIENNKYAFLQLNHEPSTIGYVTVTIQNNKRIYTYYSINFKTKTIVIPHPSANFIKIQ
jgi:hypothetical protein